MTRRQDPMRRILRLFRRRINLGRSRRYLLDSINFILGVKQFDPSLH
jgi:hypothetical protein